jgi:hypothetical protein
MSGGRVYVPVALKIVVRDTDVGRRRDRDDQRASSAAARGPSRRDCEGGTAVKVPVVGFHTCPSLGGRCRT